MDVARADLRRRWLSWVVLGLLAGVTVGLACAGFAGARRIGPAMSDYMTVSGIPDAAVLPNSQDYDTDARAAVAELPEVEATTPFMVPYYLEVTSPAGMSAMLLPTTADQPFVGEPIVEGRLPAQDRADEIAVNEPLSEQFDLQVGDTITLVQPALDDRAELPYPVPPGASEPLEATLQVVGIVNAVGDEPDALPSPAFYERYASQLAGPVNEMVYLRDGVDDLPAFRAGVEAIMGGPVNIESVEDMFGIRSMEKVAAIERGALVFFAVAVLLGGGVLVGQALVRAVTAGAADLPTWRALGFDHRMAVATIAIPATIAAVVGAFAAVGFALALSPRFPVAFSRRFLLDTGVHADWVVLGAGVAVVLIAVGAAAWSTAWLTVRLGDRPGRRPRRWPCGPASWRCPHRCSSGPAWRSSPVAASGRCRCDRRSSARSSVCSASSPVSHSVAGSRPPSTTPRGRD